MKNLILSLALLLSLTTSAQAADFTIAPFPAHGLKATPEEWMSALNDLQSINATGMVITKTWHDVEPKKGVYKPENLGKDFRDNKAAGRAVFFGFQPINTTKRDMPPDLMKMDWDDPKLIDRFSALMDQLSLDIGDNAPPKYISLANEADVYFGEHPKELDAFLKFFVAASTVIKRNHFPSARIGITVTYEGLQKGRGDIIQKLVDASDMAIFTYYPLIDLKPQPIENVGDNLDAILKVAGEKDVFLQEVGFPSGKIVGASPDMQAFFFKTVIDGIQHREQIKFASLFMLHDFSPEFCDMLVGYYGFEKAPDGAKAKFRDFLCTLGLKDTDGKEKPAWKAVKDALK